MDAHRADGCRGPGPGPSCRRNNRRIRARVRHRTESSLLTVYKGRTWQLCCRAAATARIRAAQRFRNCSTQGATPMDHRTLKDAASNVQTLAARQYRQATTAVDGYVNATPRTTAGLAAPTGV